MARSLRISIGLTLFALVIPTTQLAVFDGLPTSSLVEVIALGVLFLAFVVGKNRELDGFLNCRTQQVFSLAVAVIVLKSISFAALPSSGQFEVCYQHFDDSALDSCIPTFEPHPLVAQQSEWFPSRSTQTEHIDFGPRVSESGGLSASNWRLPQVNSFKYDKGFWPWIDSDQRIEIFPFRAEFAGSVRLEKGERVRITYVGQGHVTLNDISVSLPSNYQHPQSLEITVPRTETSLLRLEYGYLRTQPNSADTTLPYARLHVERLSGTKIVDLTPTSSPLARLLSFGSDALLILAILSLVIPLWRRFLIPFLSLPLGLIFWVLNRQQIEIPLGPTGVELSTLLIILILLGITLRRLQWQLTLFPILAVSYQQVSSEIFSATGYPAFAHQVLVRLRGNDHLVYHSLVREMLNSGFLRGGEGVFYFQPGIRYVLYLQNLIFGESSVIAGVFDVALLGFGIVAVITAIQPDQNRLNRAIQALSVISLVMWWTSSHTTQSVIFGLSEFGTWILVLYIFAVLLRPLSTKSLVAIGFMAAAVIWIRPNQAIAMMVIIFFVHYRVNGSLIERFRKASPCTAVFMGLVSLIPVHNILAGRKLAFLPGGHLNAEQRPWLTIVDALRDPSSRTFIIDQFRALLYLPSVLPDIYSSRLGLAFAMFGLLWTIAVVIKMKSPTTNIGSLLFATGVVMAQIAPFAKYTLIRYYPIHLVAIYLSVALTTIYLASSNDQARASLIDVESTTSSSGIRGKDMMGGSAHDSSVP